MNGLGMVPEQIHERGACSSACLASEAGIRSSSSTAAMFFAVLGEFQRLNISSAITRAQLCWARRDFSRRALLSRDACDAETRHRRRGLEGALPTMETL